MEIFKRIRRLLSEDNSGEDVANDLITLIRYNAVIIGIWSLFLALFFFVQGQLKFGIWFLVAAAAYSIIIYITFRYDDNIFLTSIFGIVAFVTAAVFSRTLGWACQFQNYIYLFILLEWYDSQRSSRQKIVYSGLGLIACAAVYILCRPENIIVDMNSSPYAFIGVINMIIFGLCLCYIVHSFSAQYLSTEHKLYQYNKKLKQMAGMDPLTQLMNRRAATEEINDIINRYESNGKSVSIAIGDIDFFKKVNDTYGHDCGDYVLKSLAMLFKETMKDYGFVARWGGEEFLFVFREMNGDEAVVILNRLREKIGKMELNFNSVSFNVTMTFGLEEYSSNHGVEDAIKEADNKLYMGKESGRNKVVF